MALFSSGNRKMNKRRPKTATELGRAPAPQLAKPRQLQRDAEKVKEEIYHLEVLIAKAPLMQKAQRLATLDTLPPLRSASSASRQKKKLTLAQKSQVNNRRLGLLMEWAVVLGGIAALTGWIFQWMHHWQR